MNDAHASGFFLRLTGVGRLRMLHDERECSTVGLLHSKQAEAESNPVSPLHTYYPGRGMADRGRRSRNSRNSHAEVVGADLGTYVTSLANSVSKRIGGLVAPYNLTTLEFTILRSCLQRGECTATQLAELLPVDASRISRVVNGLVDRQLLRRRRLRNDRRVVKLKLTEEGEMLASKLHQRVQEYDASLTEGVSEADMNAFAATVFKIAANSAALEKLK